MTSPAPLAGGKKIAIVQSSYIPWKGYFDLINSVDEFVLYDDMQYTKRDWRNRNYIKTPRGLEWLTIPVDVSGKYFQKIREARVSDPGWAKSHWGSFMQNYKAARHFTDYGERFEALYLGTNEELLSRINYRFIQAVCDILGIRTKISWSMDFELVDGKTERLVGLCKSTGAKHYVSGPSARNYMDESLFAREGIGVSYIDYSGYPPYPQLHGEFQHTVTVLDLIFNTGPQARGYMKTFA
ncbi:MAG TPA: WbqC family protein [Usitatibacter sp.]|jgi:hypothetical protein|nr:WbqC family protein [Usitatibacter sp.]